MQTSRRTTPHPTTWEIPLAATVAVLLVLVLAVHAGRAAAAGLAGDGWAITPREELLTSLPGILGGDAHAGLPGPRAASVSRPLLYGSIAAVEVLAIAFVVWAVVVLLRRFGPGRVRGMATRSQAEKLLGLRRLRAVAPVVRPDLYGKDGARR